MPPGTPAASVSHVVAGFVPATMSTLTSGWIARGLTWLRPGPAALTDTSLDEAPELRSRVTSPRRSSMTSWSSLTLAGLTQEKLGYRAPITTAELGAIERAEREAGLVLLGRPDDVLGITLSELLR